MARFGLGNFLYEIEVKDGTANFSFFDPDDASNTAQASVAQKDFPEGITQPDSRQVADLAFSKVSKEMNEKRDDRIRKEHDEAFEKKNEEDARARDAAADILNNGKDVQTEPTKVEDDGTRVYNSGEAAPSEEDNSSNETTSKKK